MYERVTGTSAPKGFKTADQLERESLDRVMLEQRLEHTASEVEAFFDSLDRPLGARDEFFMNPDQEVGGDQ